MAITALNPSPVDVASPSLPTAAQMALGAGSPSYTGIKTTIGQSLGFGEVWGLGNNGVGAVWPGLLAITAPPSATGNGWLLDSTLLEGQQLVGGTWSGFIQLAVSTGYIVADVWARFSWWNSDTGIFQTMSTLVAPQQTINTLYGGGISLSGAVPQQLGLVGSKLYYDLWLNITTNGTGSNSAYVEARVPTTLIQGNLYTTQGYQPIPQYTASIAYTYGDFCFNDGVNYFVLNKTLEPVDINETLFKIARRDGMKKTGEVRNERTVPVTIGVYGASRADLELKLDALTAAFNIRQQPLAIHSSDARYAIADCVSLKIPLRQGSIQYTTVTARFMAQQPDFVAAFPSTYTLANLLLGAGAAGTWLTGTVSFPGGGNDASFPTLTIQNLTVAIGTTTLTSALVNGNPYTTLAITATGAHLIVGDVLQLTNGANTQQVTVAAPAASGATSVTVTSFNANFSYPITTTTVIKLHTVTAVSVTQATDGQTITVSSLTMGYGDTITIVCDPTVAPGFTASVNGGAPLAFSGVFPVQEPGATLWMVTISCPSPVVATLVWTWTPRFLS